MATLDVLKTAGKIPELNPNNFMLYELLLTAWLKRFHSSDKALTEEAPEFNWDEIGPTLTPDGDDTDETAVVRKEFNESYRMWEKRNDIAYSSIVESCQNNPTAMILILELNTTNAKTLWNAIRDKFNLQYLSIRQRELAKFNSLYIEHGESLVSFVNRLKESKLSLKNLGYELNDDVELMGRLKTGISRDNRFTHIISNLTFNDYTWKETIKKIDVIGNLDDTLTKDNQGSSNTSNVPTETAQHTSIQKQSKNTKHKSSKHHNHDKSGGPAIYCGFCGKKGHWEKECRTKKRVINQSKGNFNAHPKRNDNTEKKKRCLACDSDTHLVANCPLVQDIKQKRQRGRQHEDEEYGYMIRATSSPQRKRSKYDAAIDSGASSHILSKDIISRNSIKGDPVVVQTAKAGVTIEGEGRADVGILEESIVIDEDTLEMNLISVSKLDNKGYTVTFGNRQAKVFDPTGTLITTGVFKHGQYMIDMRTLANFESALLGSAAPPNSIDLWHRRMGHHNKRGLAKAISKGLICGIQRPIRNITKQGPLCPACAVAKSTRHAFRKNKPLSDNGSLHYVPDKSDPNKHYANTQDFEVTSDPDTECTEHTTACEEEHLPEPLRKNVPCISTDIKGPLRVAGRSGEHYYQGFLEVDTKFLYSYVMDTRDKCLNNLEHLMEHEYSITRQWVQQYHSDGAAELISKPLVKYLASKGCAVSYSPPYTPERNALKERNHRTIFESAYAMLLGCCLNTSFWVYAIMYATRIYNRLPTPTKYGYQSPLQAKYGVVPSVARYKTFGCLAYAHIPAETREKGFVDKAYKFYYVGIDPKTNFHQVYIIELDLVKTSSHVLFDEVTVLERAVALELTIDPVPKSVKDFYYLVYVLLQGWYM
jgi:hypothetical protein